MKGLFIFNATAKPNKNPLDSTPAIASNSIFFKLSIKQSTIKFEIDGFRNKGVISVKRIPFVGKSGISLN
jgi:hypothetical protein